MRPVALLTLVLVLVATAFGAVHGHGLGDRDDGQACSACQLRSNPGDVSEPSTQPLAYVAVSVQLPPPVLPALTVRASWRTVPEQGPPARS